MNWILLILAGLFETGFATCLGKAKYAQGNAQLYWMAGFFICLAASMYLLYKASLTLPIGTAYAVWTGIGAVGTVLMGVFFLKEPVNFWRIFFITTLIFSIVGLKLFSSSQV
jgi:quaternary ammonium compound-resistance protein SugE